MSNLFHFKIERSTYRKDCHNNESSTKAIKAIKRRDSVYRVSPSTASTDTPKQYKELQYTIEREGGDFIIED